MKKIAAIVFALSGLALFVISVDCLKTRSTAARARTIRVGDSKQKVEQILGHPVAIFTPPNPANLLNSPLDVHSETWAYGSRPELRHPFDSRFPFFFPVRIRWFRPGPDDIAVEFNSSGKVGKITIP